MPNPANRKLRLTHRTDIARVFKTGRKLYSPLFALYALGNLLPYSRVSISISVRHGNAVQRNRIKRCCREAFRLIRSQMPVGLDIMIVPRIGAELTVAGLQQCLLSLGGRLSGAAAEKPSKK